VKPLGLCLLLLGAALPVAAGGAPSDPNLDPRRIINDSRGFLKEGEPEVTAEEYALYEKISPMLESQPQFAIKLLESLGTGSGPPSPAFEFILGNAYFMAGETDKAEASFLDAVKRYPSFIRAWNNLGVLYYSTGRYGEAIPCLARSLSLGDQRPDTFGLLGYCLERTGEPVTAEADYLQALARDPENPDWMEGLLRLYTQERRYGSAESVARELIRLRPAERRFWLSYAEILLGEGRRLPAMAVLEAAAGSGVAGPDELDLLADLYAQEGLDPEAAAICGRLLAAAPARGERELLRFARVLLAAGRPAQAEDALGRLPAALAPADRIELLRIQAELFADRREWPQARRKLEALLRLSPLDGRALLGLGDAELAEGDPGRAAFAFEAASRIPDSAYAADLGLANLELKGSHYDRCAEYLRKALRIEPSDAVEDYLARVETLAPAEGSGS
jgi:tetratricopeptide (TPR) repeat protein